MNEEQIEEYVKFKKVISKEKQSWIEKIKYWDMLLEEYKEVVRERDKECNRAFHLESKLEKKGRKKKTSDKSSKNTRKTNTNRANS